MKKFFAIFLAVAMMAVMFAGCGSSSSDSQGSGDAEAAEETYGEGYVFKHGFDRDFLPYSYIGDDGETTGLDIELAQAVCELYGWQYEPVPIDWAAKDAELNSGNIDCIWSGFTRNPKREKSYLFSEPYSLNTQMIMVLEGSDIKALADLAGKKVGVQAGTSAYDMLNDPAEEGGRPDLTETFASLEVYDTYTVAVNDLKAGAIDAIAIDVTNGATQMENFGGMVFLDEDMGDEIYAVGFRLEDTALCEKVNAGLKTLAENGKMDEIGRNYPQVYDYLCMINQ